MCPRSRGWVRRTPYTGSREGPGSAEPCRRLKPDSAIAAGSAGDGGQYPAQFSCLGDQRGYRFGPPLRLVQLPQRLQRDGPEAGRTLRGDMADGVVEQRPRVVVPAHLEERL